MRKPDTISKLLDLCRKPFITYRPKRYKSSRLDFASYGILSTSPLIMYVAHWMDEQFVFMSSLDMLFEYLRDQKAYFLYSWCWNIEDPGRIEIVRDFEKRHHRRYPKHKFVHLCNTIRQQEVFQEKGLTAVFCNQNCLVDENIFKPLPPIPKVYDAVYDARLKSYKRHYLASEIRNLALIYDFNPDVDDLAYMEKVKQQFAHAHFFNHSDPSGYRKLNPAQVNRYLNTCKVGLCLSEVEGAMYASIQYLLSGLPVVSTKSKGGRDVFFDEEYVLIVADKPDAVKEGVQELIQRNITAEIIRKKTIKKIQNHRLTFISLVQNIYDEEGVNRDFAAEWDNVFFNKLLKYQNHAETINRIESASLSLGNNKIK